MKYDALILGRGPAGCVAARELAQAGLKVALLAPPEKNSRKVGESLPGAARPLLHHLGLLGLINNGAHTECVGNLSSWGGETLEPLDFVRDPHGLGWHLDRVAFEKDLLTSAVEAGAKSIKGKFLSASRKLSLWTIDTDGESMGARWVIDGSGRSAAFARTQGALRQKDDRLVSLYTWVKSGVNDKDRRTLVEATADGWWYTSLLPDRSRVVAFHTDASRAKPGAKFWLQKLDETRHVKKLAAGKKMLAPVRAREAGGGRLSCFSGKGWLAAGDSALCFDPLSSQGIFNALYTGMKSAEALKLSLDGDKNALAEYDFRLEQIRAAYLRHRALYYAVEQRWCKEPFWKSRLPLIGSAR